jgi:hypothetical protein
LTRDGGGCRGFYRGEKTAGLGRSASIKAPVNSGFGRRRREVEIEGGSPSVQHFREKRNWNAAMTHDHEPRWDELQPFRGQNRSTSNITSTLINLGGERASS